MRIIFLTVAVALVATCNAGSSPSPSPPSYYPVYAAVYTGTTGAADQTCASSGTTNYYSGMTTDTCYSTGSSSIKIAYTPDASDGTEVWTFTGLSGKSKQMCTTWVTAYYQATLYSDTACTTATYTFDGGGNQSAAVTTPQCIKSGSSGSGALSSIKLSTSSSDYASTGFAASYDCSSGTCTAVTGKFLLCMGPMMNGLACFCGCACRTIALPTNRHLA